MVYGVAVAALVYILVMLLLAILGEELIPYIGETIGHLISRSTYFVATAIAGLAAQKAIGRVNERRAASLRDAPDDVQLAVGLNLRREVSYGFDEGLLSFVDGWLVFSGRHCSFSVGKEDVVWSRHDDKSIELQFLGPQNMHVIEFRGDQLSRWRPLFEEWQQGPEAEGEPVFPPIIPEASAMRFSRLAVQTGIGLIPFAIAMLAVPWKSGIFLAIAVGFLAIALILYGKGSRRALQRIASNLPYQPSVLLGPSGFRFSKAEKLYRRSLE